METRRWEGERTEAGLVERVEAEGKCGELGSCLGGQQSEPEGVEAELDDPLCSRLSEDAEAAAWGLYENVYISLGVDRRLDDLPGAGPGLREGTALCDDVEVEGMGGKAFQSDRSR